jgi:nucleotide-binding universal stress UspA family protein
MSEVTGLLISIGPMLAVLLWCNLRDRRALQADGVRAEINSAANRILGGESLLAIQVEAAMGWRRGRVHLSAPGGYESLIAKVSSAVLRRMPRDYELVIHRPTAARARITSSKNERTMAKRMLVVITRGMRAPYAAAARSAARMVRESGGTVRLMYSSPLPPPRVDRHDRVVADTDLEMARIAALASERLTALAAEMDGVPVERVVRFGRLGAELSIEAEVFGADLVALAAPIRLHLGDRFRAWYLERIALASRVPVILLPLPSDSEPVSAASISGDTRRAPWYSRRRPHETQHRADLDHPHGEPAAPR